MKLDKSSHDNENFLWIQLILKQLTEILEIFIMCLQMIQNIVCNKKYILFFIIFFNALTDAF